MHIVINCIKVRIAITSLYFVSKKVTIDTPPPLVFDSNNIGVNRPAIVREIPHFGLFPAFLRERPAFLALFQNNKNH